MNLRRTLFILPNLFTLSSIFCGFDAVRILSLAPAPTVDPRPYHIAALLLVFAMFFDTIDGRVARLTRTQSAFGMQIDSLADVMSFGIAPALLAYRWALVGLGNVGIGVSFVFCACGAIRLARFNVMAMNAKTASKPGKYIVGLPIPGAAGVILALVMARRGWPLVRSEVVAAVVLGLSALMVSTVQFRSFKDLRLNARTVALLGLAVASTVAVALRFGPPFALPWMLACYIAIALCETVFTFPSRRAARLAERAAAARRPSDAE